jgi:glycosyltransferase involved in cell wall biosynthesis
MLASSYYPKLNGTTRTVRNLSIGLSQNHDVLIVTKWKPQLPRSETYGRLRISRVGYRKVLGETLFFVILLIVKTLRSYQWEPDVVLHAHGTLPGICACLVKLVRQVPCVVSFHQLPAKTTNYGLVRSFQKIICEFADVIIVPSGLAESIFRKDLHVSHSRFAVIPNPVDPELVANSSLQSTRSGVASILYVGDLGRNKGVDVLLRAMPIVLERFGSVKLKIVGTGPQFERLVRLSDELKISHNVTFAGENRDKELALAYAESSVLVLPSSSELFGLVLIEALSMETPVIATDTIGAQSIIEHGVTGLLVRVGDVHGLAKSITEVLSNQEQAREMALRGRTQVEAKYGVQSVVAKLERTYSRAARIRT